MTPEQLGGLALAVTCGVPFVSGFALAWWLHGRVQTYGPLGALLPGWLRERI